MKFFIRPAGAGGILFDIFDDKGKKVYTVTGGSARKSMQLLDQNGACCTKIGRLRLFELVVHCIRQEEEYINLVGHFPPDLIVPEIKGRPWRMRGDLPAQSFELLDENKNLIMTHGKCWESHRDCFAVTVEKEADIPICLSVAVIMDGYVFAAGKRALDKSASVGI